MSYHHVCGSEQWKNVSMESWDWWLDKHGGHDCILQSTSTRCSSLISSWTDNGRVAQLELEEAE